LELGREVRLHHQITVDTLLGTREYVCLRVLEPGFKQLESREESKTNVSDISIFFHFDIALAEPHVRQN
jgi:hypothetical protein